MSATGQPAEEGILQAPADSDLASSGRDLLSAPADATDLELLRAFEPVVRFTSGERFFPMDVDRYVARSSLCLHHPDGTVGVLLGEGELDLETLAQPREYPFGTIEFLRFNDSLDVAEGARALTEVSKLRRQQGDVFHPGMGRLARGGFGPRIADALFSLSLLLRGTVPAVSAAAADLEYRQMMLDEEKYIYYGRVVRQGGWTALQYWFFYCYNSWRSGYHGVNDHESDWENVLIYLYEDENRLFPEWAGFASHDFHGDDLRRRWDDTEQLELVDGHPVVWAGAGSHASYFQKGEYQAAVALPLPGWIRGSAHFFSHVWTDVMGQQGRTKDPFRIPFVDYARGDGRAIGPRQEHAWSPVLIDESTPWVSQYRGLWGLYARDPISGENAPAGPKYDRDGSPRRAWYDPVGFAGLDKEPPPPVAAELLEQDCTLLGLRQEELEQVIGKKATELNALGVQSAGLEGHPHLRARHTVLMETIAVQREELSVMRKEFSENDSVLRALSHKLARLQAGRKSDPRAHIHALARPVPQRDMRFNRAAEAWSAVSLSLILLAVVGLLIGGRSYLWVGLIIMVVALLVIEAILRGHYRRTITGIASVLAVIAAILLLVQFWLWVIAGALLALAFFLMVQKVRELRG
jgi:hypothetical protein